jgi:AcrR family transcriptional regulator
MREELPPSGRGPSIWTRPERSARGPSPEHSRAEIAAAGIRLADARGLGAVTMRSAAAAVGTAPASLYRYVATRDELVELMADQVYGEFSYAAPSGQAAADLLALARQARGLYHRHPWLLDVPAAGNLPGPNAVAFIEHALAALADHPEGAADRPDAAAGQAGDGGSAGPEPLFDRAMTRILTGLLPPSPVPPPMGP